MRFFCLLLAFAVAGPGCLSGRTLERPGSALEARWRWQHRDRGGERVVATAIYRDVLAKSLFARCRMMPTDSQIFDHRARRCGSLTAAVLGVARLYLEASATPRFLHPLTLEGRLRWLDLPGRDGCWP